jgi:hypothetical protein
MNNEQHAALIISAIQILKKDLAAKRCALVESRANGYRLTEAATKSYQGGPIPDNASAADVAARMYAFVVSDVNGVLHGLPGSGQLSWQTMPPSLLKFERERGGIRQPSHIPDKPKARVPESAEDHRATVEEMERLYNHLANNPNSPRLNALRGFVNDFRDHLEFDSAACLKAVQRFLEERNWKTAVQDLQTFLTEERDGVKHTDPKRQTTNSAVRDVSEFLS